MKHKPTVLEESLYQDLKTFVVNKPQAKAYTVMAEEMYALIGRGGGKTVGIIAPWILHKVQEMPRSNGGLIGKSFTDIETKILQPLFMAFQTLGLEKDIDYLYGKRPPEIWEKPLTPIIDYQHVLSFPNGTTMELISLHLKGSANGKSLQWIVCDEAKFMNEEQLRSEVFPILRGHVNYFGHSPWYGAKLFVTDKLSPNIDWLLEKRKLVRQDRIKVVVKYQLLVNKLRLSLAGASETNAVNIQHRINLLERSLALLRKGLVYVVEASAKDNIENLSPSFFENMKRSLTPYEYSVAIENNDPTRVENNFYAQRNESHLHYTDDDDDYMKPIGVALDYQASLSPLVSFQVSDKVAGYDKLTLLDSVYVKHPLGLKEVVDKFCDMHEHRPCKEVYYFFDHTAIGRQNGVDTFADRVSSYFIERGWKLTRIYIGSLPDKDIQYEQIKGLFQNNGSNGLQITMNAEGCSTLIMAMDRTETKVGSNGKTTKNKYNETQFLTFPQEYATHFPDVFDQIVDAVVIKGLYPRSTEEPVGHNGFRRRS